MQDEEYRLGIAIMIMVLNAISALALLFVMVVYATGWKTISSFPMRLVFYLCVACLVQNLYVFMMGPFKVHRRSSLAPGQTDAYCTSMAVIKTGADLSSVIWTFLLTLSAYVTVVKSKPIDKKEWIFLLVGFALPFALALLQKAYGCRIIPINVYGYTDYYCWFVETASAKPIATSVVMYYLPLWAFFIANTVMFAKTYKKLKELEMEPYQLRVFKRMLLFPLILFVVALFSTIHRIALLAGDDLFSLAVLDYFFTSTYGLFNALVLSNFRQAYGFNPTIRDYIERLICKKCLKRRIDRESSTASDTKRIDRDIFLAEMTN